MKLVLAIKYLDIKYFLCNFSQPTFTGELICLDHLEDNGSRAGLKN